MTSFLTKRCGHCQSPYEFQASGHGCLDEPNDDRYCHQCWFAVSRALSDVPRKYESEWVDTADYTAAQLAAIERDRMAAVEKGGGAPFRRVLVPMFDLSDGGNDNVTGVVKVNGKTYSYSYWTRRDDGEFAPKAQLLVQKDLMTGRTEPWRDFEDESRMRSENVVGNDGVGYKVVGRGRKGKDDVVVLRRLGDQALEVIDDLCLGGAVLNADGTTTPLYREADFRGDKLLGRKAACRR